MTLANKAYLLALALTLLSEGPVVWVALRPAVSSGPRLLAVFAGTNLTTHGLLWSFWGYLPGGYAARLLAAELVVCALEGALYASLLGVRWRRALVASLVANALSTALGLGAWRWIFRHGGLELLR